jgi:DNA-binding NarL/FixJ family response regulator
MAVVDIALPDGCGLDLIAPLAKRGVPVAVLSTDLRPAVALAARRLGAVAVLSKELDPVDLLRLLDRVRVGSIISDPVGAASVPALTPREREVLGALLDGSSNPEIADQLGIGVETVKTHVTALMGRLDAHGRHEVGQRARDLGFDVALPYLREDPPATPR